MSSRCAAYGCGNRLGKSCRNLKITFHKFPKDPGLRLLWDQAVGCGGRQAKYSRFLCSMHFTEGDLDRTGLTVRLWENTVPSIFPDRLRKDATVMARDDLQIERDPLLANIKWEADAAEVSTCGHPAFTSVYIKEEPTDPFNEMLSTSDDVLLAKEVMSKRCVDTLLPPSRVFVDPPPTQVIKAEQDLQGPLQMTALGIQEPVWALGREKNWEDGNEVALTEPFATFDCVVEEPDDVEAPSVCSDPLQLPGNRSDPPPDPSRRQDYLSKPHACLDCAYRTDRLGNLRSHAKTHTGEKPHVCTICSHACATATHLRRHALTHTAHRPHVCPVCDQRFTCRQSLANHVRRHTGEKPFACPICSHCCSMSSNLKKHMRMHSGEKPHACAQCGYRASKSSHLKRHLLTHATPGRKRTHAKGYDPALRPYACDHCEYRCAEQGNLRQHMRGHTGEKPYACWACDYRCARLDMLKSHMVTHGGGGKTHVCAQCGAGFTRSSGLKRHAMRKHEKVS